MKYEVCTAQDADYTTTVLIPDGVCIRPNQYGVGLFAQRDFAKGEELYSDSFMLLPDEGINRVVKLVTNLGTYYVHSDIHAVNLGNGFMRVYSFDSFINHSCDPNSFPIQKSVLNHDTGATESSGDGDNASFTTIAVRDILEGEEITTDYDSFMYKYQGIPVCKCGSAFCRGFSFGFHHVPARHQLAQLHHVDQAVISAWLTDHPRIKFFSQCLPTCLKLHADQINDEVVLTTANPVIKGQILLTCDLFAVESSETDMVIFNIEKRWVQDASSLLFSPACGCDVPVFALDLSQTDNNIIYCSVLDVLPASSCYMFKGIKSKNCMRIIDKGGRSGNMSQLCLVATESMQAGTPLLMSS